MEIATICFLVDDHRIWLATKKNKIGAGKLNGYGGHLNDGETVKAAGIRELQEEAGVIAQEKDLDQRALITFHHKGKPIFLGHIFFVRKWEGTPRETAEMGAPATYPLFDIPFGQMMAADELWLRLIAANHKIAASVWHSNAFRTVKRFEWEHANF